MYHLPISDNTYNAREYTLGALRCY